MLYLVIGFSEESEELNSVEVDAPSEDDAKQYTLAALRRDWPDVAVKPDQVWRLEVKKR